MLGGDAEDGVHDGVGQVAGHHDLLEQAAGYEPEGQAGVDLAGVAGLAELGQELRGPHDRAGHQVGEEGEVDRKIQQGCRFDASTVGVDHVAESLEREETDPYRRDQSAARHFHVDAHPAENAGCSFQEEALVLEPGQQPEVGGDPEGEQQPAPALGVASVEAGGDGLVASGGSGQQRHETPVVGAVEHVAGHQHEEVPSRQAGQLHPTEDTEPTEAERREPADHRQRGRSVPRGEGPQDRAQRHQAGRDQPWLVVIERCPRTGTSGQRHEQPARGHDHDEEDGEANGGEQHVTALRGRPPHAGPAVD